MALMSCGKAIKLFRELDKEWPAAICSADCGDAYGHWAYETLTVDNGVITGTSGDKLYLSYPCSDGRDDRPAVWHLLAVWNMD